MRAFLQRGDFNFFMVDWSVGAETLNYILARSRVNEGTYFAIYVNKNYLTVSLNSRSDCGSIY